MNITFEEASKQHKDLIFAWLDEPHMKQFWDNSQEHKDDIIHFINGRMGPAPYYKGIFDYYVGLINGTPYSFLLTSEMDPSENDISSLHRAYLSELGKTITIDFGIGNNNYLGKGLAAPTLEAFVRFYHDSLDPKADTFFIDPDENNPRAKHVYEKAGFKQVGEFDVEGGVFKGSVSYLMVKSL